MGKKKVNKSINSDPILKKDYKFEKRKKLRAEEREIEKEQAEKQKMKKQQLQKIQQEVQEEIQQKMKQIPKQKIIQKLPSGLLTKKTEKVISKPSTINKQVLQLLKNEQVDSYKNHFGQLPAGVEMVREKNKNKKQIYDEKIKEEVKNMFRTGLQQKQQLKLQKMQNMEQEPQTPYILVRKNKQQKQLMIGQDNFTFNPQAFARKDIIQQKSSTNQSIISSYSDYVFIQNKEEQTIQEFRHIVINHMISHQIKCKSEKNGRGFTNGKHLIISPYMGDARSIIDIIQSHFEGFKHQNKQKMDQLEDELDFFKIGISINEKRKTIKYFEFFNRSNIIIGSAVALKALLGSQDENHHDPSFLSSVQILYIDRASTIAMQNWSHLIQILKFMNMMPKAQSVCNSFQFFRPSVTQLKGRLYRQSIVFTQFNFPELNALKNVHFHNWQGCITNKISYPTNEVNKKLQQNFHKIQIKQPKLDLEMRFDFFKRKFWDDLHNTDSMQKILIFVRTYFQFIKLKSFLMKVNASADYISEHTKKQKVQSKIAHYNNNKFRILLLSERAYYYDICQIKKIQHVIFYSLPYNSSIYFDILNQINTNNPYVKNKIISIYTKFEALSLERIVGSQKAMQMIKQYCTNVSFSV